jgi:hypothetical protein
MDSAQWFSVFLRLVFALLSDRQFREEFSLGKVNAFLTEQSDQGLIKTVDAQDAQVRISDFLKP